MSFIKSEHVKIRDVNDDIERAYEVLADYAFDAGIKDKDYLRLRLLAEEVLRLVKQILGSRNVDLWFEGNSRVSRIIMDCKGSLEGSKKDELGSISTSGSVTEEKGFFSMLADMFLIKYPEERTWSLKEYQRQLQAKKAEDKYSPDAWEDLERSLVANLADDIEIRMCDGHIRMVVTKDYTRTLSSIPVNALEATSSQIIVGTGKDISTELDKADDLIDEISLEGKEALHLKLVFEETLGMLKEMAGNFQALVWLEKYKGYYCLKLTAKTDMDYDKKKELLALASDRKNNSIKGFMDKVGDMIQNGLLSYENTMNLSQKYGGYATYNMLGMYDGIEGMTEYGMMWSLADYRNNLENAEDGDIPKEQAWDELEKSIVANIASDVLVGVKGDSVDMTIVCKMSDNL